MKRIRRLMKRRKIQRKYDFSLRRAGSKIRQQKKDLTRMRKELRSLGRSERGFSYYWSWMARVLFS